MAAKLARIRIKENIDTSYERPSTVEKYEDSGSFLRVIPVRSTHAKPNSKTKVTTPRERSESLKAVSIAGKKIMSDAKHEINDKGPLHRFSGDFTNSELAINKLAVHPDLLGQTEISNIIFALHNKLKKCQEEIQTAMKIQFAYEGILSQLQVEAVQCVQLLDGQLKEANQTEFSRIRKFLRIVELLGSEQTRLKRVLTVQKVEGISTLGNQLAGMKMIDFQNCERRHEEINDFIECIHVNIDKDHNIVQANDSPFLQLKPGYEQFTWNSFQIQRNPKIGESAGPDNLQAGCAQTPPSTESGDIL
eukprot:Gb_18592 [translate_table: standard]